MNTTRNATINTNPHPVADDVAGGAHTRPLAHAIALRLLTAKGADAAGLKGFVVTAGLAEAMVDVLEELTRRARGRRPNRRRRLTRDTESSATAEGQGPSRRRDSFYSALCTRP